MEVDLFANAVVAGIPLVFVVFGLVAWVKQLGLSGKWLTVTSLLIGLVLGVGYQLATVGIPAAFAGWFAVIVYGLGLGIVASGVYKAAEYIKAKA